MVVGASKRSLLLVTLAVAMTAGLVATSAVAASAAVDVNAGADAGTEIGPNESTATATAAGGEFVELATPGDEGLTSVVVRDDDGAVGLRLSVESDGGLDAIRVNTAKTGPDAVSALGTGNETGAVSVEEFDSPLEPGNYTVGWDGDDEAETDLRVEPRTADAVRAYRAPGDAGDELSSINEFDAWRASGNVSTHRVNDTAFLPRADHDAAVAANETIVVEGNATGLAGFVADDPHDVNASALREMLHTNVSHEGETIGEDPPHLTAVQTTETTAPGAERQVIDLFEEDASEVLFDPDGDRFVVLLDVSETTVSSPTDAEENSIEGFDYAYRVALTHQCEPAAACTEDGDVAATTVAAVEPDAEFREYAFDEERGELSIAGETTLAPWETVTVAVDGETRENATVAVEEDRTTFSTTVSVDETPEHVSVIHDERELADAAVEPSLAAEPDEKDEPRSTEPTPGADESSGTDGEVPGFGVVAAVVGVLLLSLVGWRRSRPNRSSE